MKKTLYTMSCVMLLCSISACGIKRDLMTPSEALKKQQEKEAQAAKEG